MARRLAGAGWFVLMVAAVVGIPSSEAVVAPGPIQKLTAADGAPSDYFGWSVAASGRTALVGALLDDDRGSGSGAAYVLGGVPGAWAEQAKLLAPDGVADDMFGSSVAVDGDTAVVGARGDDDRGSSSGSAHVFVRVDGAWVHQAKLVAPDGSAGDLFGGSVAVAGDTAVVAAVMDDDRGRDSGSAYVFTRTGATWALQAKLVPADGAAGDAFGTSVSLAGDTVAAGASGDDDRGRDAGSAYVFVRTGTTWAQQAKLLAPDGAAGDGLGRAVAVDGDALAVGAPFADDAGPESGTAHAFTRTAGGWAHAGELRPDHAGTTDTFGGSVDVVGGRIAAGAEGDAGLSGAKGAGSVSTFVRDAAGWRYEHTVVAPDGTAGDGLGSAVAVTPEVLVAGATGVDDRGPTSGAAYVRPFNAPPDCSAIAATPATLWPPDGAMHLVEVGGATDPDGDPVVLRIDGVLQDEPVVADADAVPSGATALLRAFRSGSGDGRVYHLVVTADDGRGGTCTGGATVAVPHNPGRRGAAVDGGPLHDATVGVAPAS